MRTRRKDVNDNLIVVTTFADLVKRIATRVLHHDVRSAAPQVRILNAHTFHPLNHCKRGIFAGCIKSHIGLLSQGKYLRSHDQDDGWKTSCSFHDLLLEAADDILPGLQLQVATRFLIVPSEFASCISLQ